jgi:GNAT superfamily N-acetyltransferase
LNPISYRYGNDLDLDEVLEVYRDSSLGDRRPIDDRQIAAQMIGSANLVVTAWDGPILVGIARTLTDFGYVGYLADLAVRRRYQRHGVGRALIEKTRARMGPRSMLVLLAAPAAAGYYPHIGFHPHPSAWTLGASDPFPVAPADVS